MPGDKEVRLKIRALDRMTNVLNRVRKQFPKLQAAVKRVSRTFAIASAKTKKFRDSMNKAGKAIGSVGRKMSTRLSAPIGLAGAAMLRVGVNFQKSINRVGALTRTIVEGKVTPAFQSLENEALRLGRSTEFSASQVADAMGFLGRAGFKTTEILESVDDVLALASASGMDLAFTADVMAKTIRQFGLDADQAQRVSDVFADVARRTNVDLETLSETFKDAAPIAKQYGLTLEQTAALTGLLGDVGIQGSKAGTALKNIMLKIAAPTATGTKLLKQMGITTVDMAGKMKSVGQILTEIGPKLGSLNKDKQLQVMNELFGLRGITGAMALMSKAMEKGENPVAVLSKTLEGSTGAAKEMQEIMLRGAPKAMANFQSALEGLGIAFARSGLIEAFTSVLEHMTKFFGWLQTLSPAMKKFMLVTLGIVAALGPLFIAIGTVLPLIGKLAFLLPVLKVGLAAVGVIVGLISIKFIVIAAVIGLVVAGIVRLVQRWDKMISAFKSGQGFFNSVGRFFKAFVFDMDSSADAMKRAGREGEKLKGIKVGKRKVEVEEERKGILGGKTSLGALTSLKAIGGAGQTNTNNARVDVNINDPGGNASVRGKADNLDLFNLNTGFAGATQ